MTVNTKNVIMWSVKKRKEKKRKRQWESNSEQKEPEAGNVTALQRVMQVIGRRMLLAGHVSTPLSHFPFLFDFPPSFSLTSSGPKSDLCSQPRTLEARARENRNEIWQSFYIPCLITMTRRSVGMGLYPN